MINIRNVDDVLNIKGENDDEVEDYYPLEKKDEVKEKEINDFNENLD